jgi:hypothetical protein
MKLKENNKGINLDEKFAFYLPRSIENVGVEDNGIERDKYV